MRCPVCKAEAAQEAQCRRCRADLTLLARLESQRRRALAEASARVLAGDARGLAAAHAAASSADRWRRDPDSLRLLAVVSLLRRDFGRAWRYHQLLRRFDGGGPSA
jgi:hypothetical protein